MITVYAYGIFNETIKDRAYYKQVYEKKGYTNIKVKRVRTDTPGLKMYEITMCNKTTR